MKTQPNSMARTAGDAVDGLYGDGALHAPPKKLMTPHNRFFCWFSLTLLFLGPFGFIVGPLMARRGLRKAEQLCPQESDAARRGDQGFTAAQWWS